MPGRAHLPAKERNAVSRIHFLLSKPGLLHASLQVNRRRCGKKRCRCVTGKPHISLYLSILAKGRQHHFGVPPSWEARLREWIERDREVRRLLLEISGMYRDRFCNRKE